MDESNIEDFGFTAFIPNRLNIEDRKELSFFPFNIMFSKVKVESDQIIQGFATYNPLIDTYLEKDNTCSLQYSNVHGGNSLVVVSYQKKDDKYHYSIEKLLDNKSVGLANGVVEFLEDEEGWKRLFIQVGLLQLSDGEKCEFKYTKKEEDQNK